VPAPTLSRAEAEAIAAAEWERRGLLAGRAGASARATAGRGSYTVHLHWGAIPMPWMEIDARTGKSISPRTCILLHFRLTLKRRL
jgi:hypothetical protein